MLPHVFAVINNAQTENISLGGTSQDPLSGIFNTELAGGDSGWDFLSNGTLEPTDSVLEVSYDWNSNAPNPIRRYWMRVTNNNGRNPEGIALNTWVSLDTSQSFYWNYALNNSSGDSAKVEISSKSDGSIILATGYYGVIAEGSAGGGGGGGGGDDPNDPIDEFLDPKSNPE